jgi:hypothetical protein
MVSSYRIFLQVLLGACLLRVGKKFTPVWELMQTEMSNARRRRRIKSPRFCGHRANSKNQHSELRVAAFGLDPRGPLCPLWFTGLIFSRVELFQTPRSKKLLNHGGHRGSRREASTALTKNPTLRAGPAEVCKESGRRGVSSLPQGSDDRKEMRSSVAPGGVWLRGCSV